MILEGVVAHVDLEDHVVVDHVDLVDLAVVDHVVEVHVDLGVHWVVADL